MNQKPPLNSEGWFDRAEELMKSPHLRTQVERIMPALVAIQGHRAVASFEDVLRNVAELVAILELNPLVEETACVDGITVTRGPMEGYGIHVWASTVFSMHLDLDKRRKNA